ncbi:hypothetical protein NC653_036111 [Populus alba x Populus x berolinensis]|uniref:Uncharacterized protein n=1 Tax=Populus alba x Populus x berolinensis TaxID=444605 RepID=A0AAD6LJ11_9ROSI|nr:hypothetical protein NC653_036111 [Populus alba x Populus x berolinensis]
MGQGSVCNLTFPFNDSMEMGETAKHSYSFFSSSSTKGPKRQSLQAAAEATMFYARSSCDLVGRVLSHFSLPEQVPDDLHKILEPGVHIDSKAAYFNAKGMLQDIRGNTLYEFSKNYG